MRPKSIIWFERLYLVALAASTGSVLYYYKPLREHALAIGVSPSGPIAAVIISILVSLIFWFTIARRASNVMKWILVVLTGISMLGFLQFPDWIESYGMGYALSSLFVLILSLVSTAFLFRQDAVVWLKSKGLDTTVNPSIFE